MAKKKKRPLTDKEQLSIAASLMGKKGGPALQASLTPDERRANARLGAETRWKDHEYSTKQSAVSHRKRRLKEAGERQQKEEAE